MKYISDLIDNKTLRRQLLTWVLFPMVVLLILNAALAYKFGHDSADRRHDRFLLDTSGILLDQLRTNDGRVEFNLHSGALKMFSADSKDFVYYKLSGYQQQYQFGNSDLPEPLEELSKKPIFYEAEYKGKPVRMMAALMPEADVSSGYVNVIVGKTLVLHHERAQEWIWRVLPAQLFLMVLAGIAVWWGIGRGLQPLLRLRDEVERRSSSDLSPLPEQSIIAEVRPLIHGFNELMGRLEKTIALQDRFIADAAHQLRTPIAGLKAQTDLALSMDDPDEIRHSLLQMRKATEHTAHLVSQLLSLAHAEPELQQQADKMRVLDMVALTRQVTENWIYEALKKDIDLGFETDADTVTINGDTFLLGEMLNNLLDNAIRYTQHGGIVTVRVSTINNKVQLDVEDNGQGIPESERERVFERFYRVLGSNQDGCGLGLSIVREIAQRHNAEIHLLSGADGVGTLARLLFPAS